MAELSLGSGGNEKIRIEYDGKKRVITIITPQGNSVEIGDEEQSIRLTDMHGNEVALEKNGITLTSNMNITLNAQGGITLNAQGGIVMESKGNIVLDSEKNIALDAGSGISGKAETDFDIEGMNVRAHAQIAASVKGTLAAELSSVGHTTVKGGVVMIN